MMIGVVANTYRTVTTHTSPEGAVGAATDSGAALRGDGRDADEEALAGMVLRDTESRELLDRLEATMAELEAMKSVREAELCMRSSALDRSTMHCFSASLICMLRRFLAGLHTFQK